MKFGLKFGVFAVGIIYGAFASASGRMIHLRMSAEAINLLPAGELKLILSEHRRLVYAGTVYPDWGYWVAMMEEESKDAGGRIYADYMHSEVFLNEWYQYLRTHCRSGFKGMCVKRLAFFFGLIAHNLEDTFWDRFVLNEIADRYYSESDHPLDDAQMTDFWLDFVVPAEGISTWAPTSDIPYDDLRTIFARNTSLPPLPKRLEDTLSHDVWLHLGEMFAFSAVLKEQVEHPWLLKNYWSMRGGVMDCAEKLNHTWQEVFVALSHSDEHRFYMLESFSWPYWSFYFLPKKEAELIDPIARMQRTVSFW